MNRCDWQWWQFFLEIAEQGSLSKAAKSLNISQPTLSRHLHAMEKELGQPLFDRSTQGLTLTTFSEQFLIEGKAMRSSARRLQRLAQGQETQLKGRIRLSVNQMIAQYYLPDLLPNFIANYPEISIEIDVNNKESNIDKRDTDAAIRMFKPTQLDLVAKKIHTLRLGFFAGQAYIDSRGTPYDIKELFSEKHVILGYDKDSQFVQGGQKLGINIRNEDFSFRSDYMPLQFELAKNNVGIAATHRCLALKKGLKQILPHAELPSLPIYLVCHRDIRCNRKIRVLMEHLTEHLPPLFDV